MGNTYASLVAHIIFCTKERAPLITAESRERLYEYMGGIIRRERGSLLEIGGMPDHVHLLLRYKASVSLSVLVRFSSIRISSRWLVSSRIRSSNSTARP